MAGPACGAAGGERDDGAGSAAECARLRGELRETERKLAGVTEELGENRGLGSSGRRGRGMDG